MVACLLIPLSVTVMADSTTTNDKDVSTDKTYTLEFSDDFTKAEINGSIYTSINYINIYFDVFDYEEIYSENIIITGEIADSISYVSYISSYDDDILIKVSLELYTGEYMDKYYLKDEYMDDYSQLLTGYTDECTIDFEWPEDNRVVASTKYLLENEPIEYNRGELESFFSLYCVYCIIPDTDSIGVNKGSVYSIEGSYYYFDYQYNKEHRNENDEEDIIYLHKITNEELIEDFQEAESLCLEDLDILYDNELSQNISKILFAFLFLLIPVGLITLSIILLIRLPKKYRKILITLLTLSVIEIIVYVCIAILLF
jgi:hypothetical protein